MTGDVIERYNKLIGTPSALGVDLTVLLRDMAAEIAQWRAEAQRPEDGIKDALLPAPPHTAEDRKP